MADSKDDIEKGAYLQAGPSISLEELIKLGKDPSLNASINPTPRPSIGTVAITDDFARTLYKINANLSEMKRMSEKLGGPSDSHEHRARLNALTEVTKDMIMQANTDLRELRRKDEEASSGGKFSGGKDTLQNRDRLRLTKLTKDFQVLMEQFQNVQRVSLEKCQDFVVRAQAITTTRDSNDKSFSPQKDKAQEEEKDTVSKDEKELLLAGDSVKSPLIATRRQEGEQDMLGLQNEISYNQALIQEREQGIQEIEAAMAEVHEIFCDLGLLVGEQQGMVDNIEANMEASALRTRAAVRELLVTRERRMRWRGNVCCMILLALFVFIIAIAIINAIF